MSIRVKKPNVDILRFGLNYIVIEQVAIRQGKSRLLLDIFYTKYKTLTESNDSR